SEVNCAVPSCGKKQSLHCLPSDPNIRKEWMNLIFNEDPDLVGKNLVLCSRHFTTDSFANKAQFNAGFSERLKLKEVAVPNILYPTLYAHTIYRCTVNIL
uniref:THAP-type domain-containing protein n=1 Tax=Sinocyclocheilus rhinocerous TaxID=307959 RepID=A0A673KGT1_9TELE